MNLSLEGRTAVVTRSTKGFGLAAAAKGLADTGANVVVNGRNRNRLDRIRPVPALCPEN